MSMPKGWQEVRLGDICDRVTTKNKEDCRNILTISAEYGFIRQDKFFTKVVASKDLSKYILLQRDDFVYNKSYSAGYPYGIFRRLKEDKGVATSLYIYFRFHTGNVTFLEYMFESGCLDLQLREIAQEGARNHGLLNVQVKDFFDLKIPYPPLKEQEKIAEILSSCDEHIKNLKNLKSELEKEKLHLMNELLSGKTRFANFTTPWQEVKLGDILEYEQPTLYIVESTEYSDSNPTPVLTAGKTFILGYTDEDFGIYKAKDEPIILFDDFTTATQFVDFDFKVKSSACKILKAKNGVNIKVVFGLLQMIKYVAKDHKRHWISMFQDIKIKLPSLEEQKKIGEVLSACDERLECLNELITAQTTLKSHLLTELLSGNIRVQND